MEKQPLTPHNLVQLGQYFSIKKHEKNKIRLGVKPSIKEVKFEIPDNIKNAKLSWEALWQSLPGIESVKPRLLILAVDIDYDAEKISPEMWDDWVKMDATPVLLTYLQNSLTQLQQHLDENG